MPKKKTEHYVNNKELLEAMIAYRTSIEESYKKTFNRDLREQPKQERAKKTDKNSFTRFQSQRKEFVLYEVQSQIFPIIL